MQKCKNQELCWRSLLSWLVKTKLTRFYKDLGLIKMKKWRKKHQIIYSMLRTTWINRTSKFKNILFLQILRDSSILLHSCSMMMEWHMMLIWQEWRLEEASMATSCFTSSRLWGMNLKIFGFCSQDGDELVNLVQIKELLFQ